MSAGGGRGAPPGAPDSDGMWEATADLPEQASQGAASARAVATSGGLPPAAGLTSVVALGTGASGIAHEVVAAVASPRLGLPVVVVKGYSLPAFVGPSTLVLASSFRGDTDETVAAASAAVERGARLVAVTSGGRLGDMAASAGVLIPVPGTIPHARAAIGAMTVAPLVALGEMGLLAGVGPMVTAAVDQLARRRDELVAAGAAGLASPVGAAAGAAGVAASPASVAAGAAGLAAGIAGRIGRTIPLVHGGEPLGWAAAQWWASQVNENPKSPAFAAAQPELCHSQVAGWGQLGDVTRQLITVVDLRHDFEHAQVGRRFGLVDEILDEVVASVVEVRAAGQGPLAQVLDLMLVGDYVALTLAAREGIDPGPVPVLAELEHAVALSP